MKTNARSARREWAAALSAAVLAVPSAFGVCVFHHMRACGDASAYYADPARSLVADMIQVRAILFWPLIPVLFLAFFLGMRRAARGIAGWLAAAPMAFNMLVSLSMEHSGLRHILLPFGGGLGGAALNAAAFLGFEAMIGFIVSLLYGALDRRGRVPRRAPGDAADPKLLFAAAMAAITVGWLPGILLCYPGSLASDTLLQIKSFMGLRRMEASHPVLTTAFYGLLFSLGRSFGSDAASLFKIVVLQALVNAAAMSLASVRVYRYTRSKAWFAAAVGFYALLPVWGLAAQKAIKDVIHAGWYLLFYLEFLRRADGERLQARDALWLCLCALMVAFTRKATVYLVVVSLAALILSDPRRHIRDCGICLAVVVGAFLLANQALYPLLDIEEEREAENYSLQLQQVALYCREYGGALTDEEREIVDGTLDYDAIVRDYTPMISDPVKSSFHGTAEDHRAFWELYFKLLRRHPGVFVREVIMGSFEHLNPWYDGNNAGVYIERDPSFHSIWFRGDNPWRMQRYWNSWFKAPVARMLNGTGIYVWLLLALLGYAVRTRAPGMLTGLVPDLVLLAGLFLSHVNGEIRYGYPMIATAPLILAYVAGRGGRPDAAQAPREKPPAPRKRGISNWRALIDEEDGAI